MARNSTLVVCGTATLDQVTEVVRLGVPRDKAIMYSSEQAGRRLRHLKQKRKRTHLSTTESKTPHKTQSKLLVKELWPRITSLVQKNPGRSYIAVAFFSSNASKQLPLESGSILVVNLSEPTLAAGLTNPYEIEKLLHNGVEIYNNPKLHAKVFVFPDSAVVGSNNASHSSANDLLEAAIEVTARGTVVACKKYVKSLCQSPPLGAEHLEYLKGLYRAPAMLPTTSPSNGHTDSGSRFWAVRVQEVEYDRFDKLAESRGTPLAEAELSSGDSSSNPSYIDSFWMSGNMFCRDVTHNDIVSQLITNDGALFAHPPSRVVHIEHYVKEKRTNCVMVFLETFEGKQPLGLDTVIWQLKAQRNCPNAMDLRSIKTAKRITDQRLREQFLNLWV
jgi:hypothetical protein